MTHSPGDLDRASIPAASWPEIDRSIWTCALQPVPGFMGPGYAASLSAATMIHHQVCLRAMAWLSALGRQAGPLVPSRRSSQRDSRGVLL